MINIDNQTRACLSEESGVAMNDLVTASFAKRKLCGGTLLGEGCGSAGLSMRARFDRCIGGRMARRPIVRQYAAPGSKAAVV
jgi:hypothetical protein